MYGQDSKKKKSCEKYLHLRLIWQTKDSYLLRVHFDWQENHKRLVSEWAKIKIEFTEEGIPVVIKHMKNVQSQQQWQMKITLTYYFPTERIKEKKSGGRGLYTILIRDTCTLLGRVEIGITFGYL